MSLEKLWEGIKRVSCKNLEGGMNMEKTLKNLMEAFAGESQANRKYLAFARKAEEEDIREWQNFLKLLLKLLALMEMHLLLQSKNTMALLKRN